MAHPRDVRIAELKAQIESAKAEIKQLEADVQAEVAEDSQLDGTLMNRNTDDAIAAYEADKKNERELTGKRNDQGDFVEAEKIPTMEDLNTWYHIMVKQAGEDWMKDPRYKEQVEWYNEQKKLTGQATNSGFFIDGEEIPIAEWDENQKFDADGNPIPAEEHIFTGQDEKVVTYDATKDDTKIHGVQPPEEIDDIDKDERTDAYSEKQKFMGIDREQGRAMAMQDNLPERSMGFKADDGGNMSVDEKDDFWKTQEGYDKAVEMYGSKPAWVKEPTMQWNPKEQKYEEVEPEEFEDLSRPSISADIKKLFG